MREHFPFIRFVLLAIMFLCCAVKSMHTRHAHICRGFELFIILQVNLSQNCWNSGIVRKFRCQNHSSFNGFHWKIHKHTALDLKWIRVKFHWNVVHLVDTTPIFFNRVFFIARFPFIIQPCTPSQDGCIRTATVGINDFYLCFCSNELNALKCYALL